MSDENSPGPGRSTSEAALNEVKREVARRNEEAQRAARRLRAAREKVQRELRRRWERDSIPGLKPARIDGQDQASTDPRFEIEIVERDHTRIINVRGELDLATAPLLKEQLKLAEAAGAVSVLVDLDQVEFMDSAGLHVLLAHLAGNGDRTQYSLTRGSPQVQRLFQTAGVLDQLPFAAD